MYTRCLSLGWFKPGYPRDPILLHLYALQRVLFGPWVFP